MECTLLVIIASFMSAHALLSQRINVQNKSLLLFLDRLYDMELRQNDTVQNTSQFMEECNERSYDFTVYYRMVYFRVCGSNITANETDQSVNINPSSAYTNFCNDLELYYIDNYSYLLSAINRQANLQKIYGVGIKSDERWLAYEACKHIEHYYKAKQKRNLNSSNSSRIYPRFTEWFISAVPFSLPVACGFTEESHTFDNNVAASSDCLAPSYKWALYITFLIDSLILLAIVVANVIIITVLCRLKSRSAHGFYKLSLACADLMIGFVMAGGMSTAYRTYFGTHVFNDDGHQITQLDFHSQAYVDGFGTITVLSLSSSVFTLVAISMDRFYAILRSFKYNGDKAKTFSVVFIVAIWGFSLLLALFPLFTSTISYNTTSLGVIIAIRFYIAYVVCLGGALLCVWIVNIGMYVCIKRRLDKNLATMGKRSRSTHTAVSTQVQDSEAIKSFESVSHTAIQISAISSKINTAISSRVKEKEHKHKTKKSTGQVEVALATTVQIIVCAFTLAIVPCILVMITGESSTLEHSSPNFNPAAKAAWNGFSYLASRILFSNSFVNCVIYSYRSREFLYAVKSLFSLSSSRDRIKTSIFRKPLFYSKRMMNQQ